VINGLRPVPNFLPSPTIQKKEPTATSTPSVVTIAKAYLNVATANHLPSHKKQHSLRSAFPLSSHHPDAHFLHKRLRTTKFLRSAIVSKTVKNCSSDAIELVRSIASIPLESLQEQVLKTVITIYRKTRFKSLKSIK
jgi:hypothetical protein